MDDRSTTGRAKRCRLTGWACLLVLLAVGSAGAQILDRATAVLELSETVGPAAALDASTRLLDDEPGSVGALLQFAELLVETRGVPQARDALTLRQAALPSRNFEIALAFLDRSTGRAKSARRRWSEIDVAELVLSLPFDQLLVDLERRDLGVPADSLVQLEQRIRSRAQRLGGMWVDWARTRSAAFEARSAQDSELLASRASDLKWSWSRNLLLRGRLHSARGDVEASAADYRECLRRSETIGARRTAALAGSYFGLLLDGQMRFEAAAAMREKAVDTFESFGDSLALAYAAMGLGWDYDRLSRAEESVATSERALELWTALGNDWGRVQVLNNLGVAHFDSDAWTSAEHRFQEAIEILERSPNPRQREMVLNNVGLLESRRGRPDRAVEIYRELLELHRQSADRDAERRVLNNLGLACLALGESEQAREYFRQVIDSATDGDSFPVAATSNLAMILADEGDLEGARQLLERALPRLRERDGPDASANVLAWLGRIHQRSGNPERALQYLARSDSLFRMRGNSGSRVATLIRKATAQSQVGQSEEAAESSRLARELAVSLGAQSLQAASACLEGKTEEALGDCRAATNAAHDALRIWFDQDRGGDRSADRSDITAASAEALRVLVRCALREGEGDSAFVALAPIADAILSAESRSVRGRRPADVDSLVRRERELRREVQSRRDALLQQPDLPQARWKLADVETAWHVLRRKLASARVTESPDAVLSLEALRAASEGRCFLAYLMGPTLPGIEDAPVLRFIFDGHSASVDLLADEQLLRRRISAWQSLSKHPQQTEGEREAEIRLARQLAWDLLPDRLRQGGGSVDWVIAADGALSSMSFAALVVDDHRPTRLVEKVALERARSWSHWLGLVSEPASTTVRSVVRADPEELGAAIRGNGDWPRAAVLHIDSHGHFDRRRPWLSGLYAEDPRLSDSAVDPFLQQADLPMITLDHALVTLAACETAEAEDSPLHSSASSFAWAMQDAGARAVLGSTWEVEKSLAAWTTDEVYAELAKGEPLARALQIVQRELMANERSADPFYWAGWQVMGDGAQRIDLDRRHAPPKAWTWWGLSTLLSVLAFVLWRRSTSAG